MKVLGLVSLCLILLLPACNMPLVFPPETPTDITQTLDAARTEAAQTVIAEMAAQATATQPPASPTSTLAPTSTFTYTASPTRTQTLTQTSTPTWIPSRTSTPIPPTPTFTRTFTPTATRTTAATATPLQPAINVLAVEKNWAVTLDAKHFPKNETFYVRIGPASQFYVNYVVAGTVPSGNGSFKFTILLPTEVTDVNEITVRLDSVEGDHADVSFKNANNGQVEYDEILVSASKCEITTSPAPSKVFNPRADFDAVWNIKNTSDTNWNLHEADYQFIGGREMHKYEDRYDIPETVEPGKTARFVVDMLAPDRAGTYTTHWALVQNKIVLCHLPLEITVR